MTSSPTPRDLERPMPQQPAIDPARDRLRAQLFGERLDPRVRVHDGEHALDLHHGDQDLAQSLENQLNTIEEFAVQVADFEHDGHRYRTTVMTVSSDGTVQPWARTDDDRGCVSPMLAAPAEDSTEVREISFVVLAVDLDSPLVIADPYPLVYIPPMAPPKGSN